MSQSQTNWEADKMLDVYIYDYFVKRKWLAAAKAFQAEAKVLTDPVAIDAPGGFLFEWWSVFWDIFIARTNEKHSESAASYIETQLIKTRELQQQQQHQRPQQQPQQQQMQMQQLLFQRQAQQQQQRDGAQILNGTANGLVGNEPLMGQNSRAANALAAKMYDQRLKLPLQRDTLDDAALKQRFGDNNAQLLDPNHASLLKSAAVGGQPLGRTLQMPGGISGNLQQIQNRNQQLPVSTPDIKNEISPMMNPRSAGQEGSLLGAHGSNQGSNNLTLKGWPLTGLEQLRSGILQQQKSLMQSPQPFHQLQLQQQILLQGQQNMTSPSASELECQKLRLLLGNRSMSFGKDGHMNYAGDGVPNVGSPQVGCAVLPRGETDMMMKLQAQQQQIQNNNQQQQHYLQHPFSNQQSRSSNQQLHHQDKVIGAGSITADGSISNTSRVNDQASKTQIGRKRKQAVSSSGPANSSGTANSAGPSPSSAPSTPSTHTVGDAISKTSLPNGGSSKSPLMFGSDGMSTLKSAPNQMADVDHYIDDGSLDDNVDSFLTPDADPRDTVGRSVDVSKGFTFTEFRLIPGSTKVECCHFSFDGKLLATGGHDKKVVLWCTETFTPKSTLEEHSQTITDVRFHRSMPRLATSSADKTVRVWDADNPGYSLRNFAGHSAIVTSLDFHPIKEDLICSCDANGEIRYWSIQNGSCTRVFKGGMTQVRFQPYHGRYLAAAAEKVVSIFDVETQACKLKLQGHKNRVSSLCWDSSGEYLASVSEDVVKVWAFGPGSKGELIHELNCSGNEFRSCVFHPTYTSLLVIGCYKSLELWNMTENKMMTLPAHDNVITSLTVSNVTNLVASGSHDSRVKIWK